MLVLFRLPLLVLMPGRAIFDLGLEGGRRDARRVLENELAPGGGRVQETDQTQHAQPAQHQRLDAGRVEPAVQLPEEYHGEDPHGDERLALVLLHQLVDRLPMLDDIFGLKAGQHRDPAADHARP